MAAKEAGITEDITTYWARHTFTTTIMRKGASIEMASGLPGPKALQRPKATGQVLKMMLWRR